MDYRQSKYQFCGEIHGAKSPDESIVFQLDVLNDRFSVIAKRLIEDRDLVDFEPSYKRETHSVFDLGTVFDSAVMTRLVDLAGYRHLHRTLKMINADFHFQILPSAGMVRPTPSLLLIIELDKGYGSRFDRKCAHMYPDMGANDNVTFVETESGRDTIHFQFAT